MDWLVSLGLIACVVLIVYLSWRDPKKRVRALQRKERDKIVSEQLAQTIEEYVERNPSEIPEPPKPKKVLPTLTETVVRERLEKSLTSRLSSLWECPPDESFIDAVHYRYTFPLDGREEAAQLLKDIFKDAYAVYRIGDDITGVVNELGAKERKTRVEYALLRSQMRRLHLRRRALGDKLRGMLDTAEKHLEEYLRE